MYQLTYEERPVFLLHYIVPNKNSYLLLERKKKEEENTSCLKQFGIHYLTSDLQFVQTRGFTIVLFGTEDHSSQPPNSLLSALLLRYYFSGVYITTQLAIVE